MELMEGNWQHFFGQRRNYFLIHANVFVFFAGKMGGLIMRKSAFSSHFSAQETDTMVAIPGCHYHILLPLR